MDSYLLEIQNATQVLTFPCEYLFIFQDSVLGMSRGRFLSDCREAFGCWPQTSLLCLNLNSHCCAWQMVVLDGIVSRYLTVLPSDTIFHPSFKCNTIFWMIFTDFARCIGVQPCDWWVAVRGHPFGRIATVYLYEVTLRQLQRRRYSPLNLLTKNKYS